MAAEWQGQCHLHGRLPHMKTCAESEVVDLFEEPLARSRPRSCTCNYAFESGFHNRTLAFASGPKLRFSLPASRDTFAHLAAWLPRSDERKARSDALLREIDERDRRCCCPHRNGDLTVRER